MGAEIYPASDERGPDSQLRELIEKSPVIFFGLGLGDRARVRGRMTSLSPVCGLNLAGGLGFRVRV